MTRLRATFRSLGVRDFRLYFTGQTVSMIGTWMQRLGQEWLVLELTGSGTWLGVVTALQFLPMLVLTPLGGVLADRADMRRLIIATHWASGLLALALGLLVGFDLIELWMVCVLAFGLGVARALDNPARQSLVLELVGKDDLQNAITLNSILVNAARAIGPALAGVLIVTVGLAASFFVNAASYLAVILAVSMLDRPAIAIPDPISPRRGQLREGLAHVWRTPILRSTLIVMGVAGLFAYEFAVTLPLLARFTFGGDAATLGLLNGALGTGAIIGGLVTAARGRPEQRGFLRSALLFGCLLLAVASAPSLGFALLALALTGAVSIQFLAVGKTLLQLHAGPGFQGRVMSLWAIAFLGTTPLGAPLVGWIGEVAGARSSLALGGVAVLLAALATRRNLRRAAAAEPAPDLG